MKYDVIPDVEIRKKGPVSAEFLARNIRTFGRASQYVFKLPYGRNANKENLLTVFTDACGTCSTKHALLKLLADEQNLKGLDLVVGIFRMNADNTAKVAGTLSKYGLSYIPEAHNYLKYRGKIIDFTGDGFDPEIYGRDVLTETKIAPDQITFFKVNLHKTFLKDWLAEHLEIRYSLDEFWEIKEQCIRDLSDPTK